MKVNLCRKTENDLPDFSTICLRRCGCSSLGNIMLCINGDIEEDHGEYSFTAFAKSQIKAYANSV